MVASGVPAHAAECGQPTVNPNERCELWQWLELPLEWNDAGKQTQTMGTMGYVTSGAVVFDARSSPDGDLASCHEWASLDPSHGHSAPGGAYHYHAVSSKQLHEIQDSKLVWKFGVWEAAGLPNRHSVCQSPFFYPSLLSSRKEDTLSHYQIGFFALASPIFIQSIWEGCHSIGLLELIILLFLKPKIGPKLAPKIHFFQNRKIKNFRWELYRTRSRRSRTTFL